VDRRDSILIEGWITCPEDPNYKFELEFTLDDAVIGRVTADQFRQDLADAGKAGGHCAFSFEMPPFLPKRDADRVAVRLADSEVFVKGGLPVEARPGDAAAETVSKFGGLWIDRRDWLDRLAAKHRAEEISDELSLAIFRFVRDGYVVLRDAVPLDIVDAVNEEIERAWASPPEGLRIETFEPDGQMRVIPPNVEYRAGRTKMLDLYAYAPVVRQAIAAPKVTRFLRAIFEDRPKAFQGLAFWNGSQQAIHKDTAYVKVDSNPMHLAATWLALEDIAPGTGELIYYIGSHRAPDFLFGGYSKWMETHTGEHEQFLKSLHSDAEKLGQVKGSFLARKGDVLVWHADLAHGGSEITNSDRTRRSFVTHFTAASDEPFYRRTASYKEAELADCRFVSQYADVCI
jgi:hypothetical protein